MKSWTGSTISVCWRTWGSDGAQIDGLLQRNAALERDLRSEQILSASMAGRRSGEVRHDRNGQLMPVPAPDQCARRRSCVRLHFATGQWPAKDRTCQRLGWEQPDGLRRRMNCSAMAL